MRLGERQGAVGGVGVRLVLVGCRLSPAQSNTVQFSSAQSTSIVLDDGSNVVRWGWVMCEGVRWGGVRLGGE